MLHNNITIQNAIILLTNIKKYQLWLLRNLHKQRNFAEIPTELIDNGNIQNAYCRIIIIDNSRLFEYYKFINNFCINR